MSIKEKIMLRDAIENSELLPSGQKKVLTIISSADYPVSAQAIEKEMGASKQATHFSIKKLLARNFIIREKDGTFVYKPNETRSIELIDRYIKKLSSNK